MTDTELTRDMVDREPMIDLPQHRRIERAAGLKPELVWVRFKVVAPGASSGMAYDGRVWLQDGN